MPTEDRHIKCESLTVVNEKEEPVVSIGGNKAGGFITLQHTLGASEIMLQFNQDGGEIGIWKRGKLRIGLDIDYENGVINVSNHEGKTVVKIGATEPDGNGFVETYSKEGVTCQTSRMPDLTQ